MCYSPHMICKTCALDKPTSDFWPEGSHRPRGVCRACSPSHPRGVGSRVPRPASVAPADEQHLFHTIVADPPWPMNNFIRLKGDERPPDYPLLTLPDICSHTPPARSKAHLWLWVLNQHVDWGYEVARAWGFEPIQMITWTKPGGGMGKFQCNTESVLVCRKGDTTDNTFNTTGGTYFYWPRGQHSEKPNQFYDLVERTSPGPYLEMYARRPRPGWSQWGNELPDPVEGVGVRPPIRRGKITILLHGMDPVTVLV